MNNSESWEEAYESWLEHLALTQLCGAYVVQALNRRPQQQPFTYVNAGAPYWD
jgi:hypothetical protein